MQMDFFQESREASRIKGQIVAKYFKTWADIISKYTKDKFAYIDLFCGPGRYEDGTESTPLLVLNQALSNSNYYNRFISIFTDKEEGYVEQLKSEVSKITGINNLKYKPEIKKLEVKDQVVEEMRKNKLIPSFIFLDPCGYKGLSLDLVNSVIKDWGCECLFFFNYNRINGAIHIDQVEDHVVKIFGLETAEELRNTLKDKTPYQREIIILERLVDALKQTYGKFIQSFCVKDKDKNRTSHYLIFVTKNFNGYHIMREIMAGFSTNSVEGVPSFEYNLRDEQDLFYQPLKELKEMLLGDFVGQEARVDDIYRIHSPGRNYILKNYKTALRQLYDEGKIQAVSKKGKIPRKGTMSDENTITFQ